MTVYYDFSVRIIMTMLEKNRELIDFRTCKRETALHLAAKRGNEMAASALLRAGARTDAIDYKSRTPLLTAIHWRNDAVAAYIVRAGAALCRVTGSKQAPLHAAVARHNLQLALLMLEHGALVVDPRDDDLNWTVIHMACESGKLMLRFEHSGIVLIL